MASVALFFSCSVLASLLILASSLSARSFSASSRPMVQQVTVVLGGGGMPGFRADNATFQSVFCHSQCIPVLIGFQLMPGYDVIG